MSSEQYFGVCGTRVLSFTHHRYHGRSWLTPRLILRSVGQSGHEFWPQASLSMLTPQCVTKAVEESAFLRLSQCMQHSWNANPDGLTLGPAFVPSFQELTLNSVLRRRHTDGCNQGPQMVPHSLLHKHERRTSADNKHKSRLLLPVTKD